MPELISPLVILGFFILLVLISIKQVNQYEKGVKFQFGKFVGIMDPGWRIVWPIIQTWQRVDMRVRAVDVPSQAAITKDNVSAQVDAVIFYRVADAKKVILEVENFGFAIFQLAQTTMRNAVGETILDELLSQRERVAAKIHKVIEGVASPWGIGVESVQLKDIILPDEMKRIIAKQAEAERVKRAIIIRAEGELIAADNMAKAAEKLSQKAGGLHLRTLQTITDSAADKANTIVFAAPLEVVRALEGLVKKLK